MSEKVNALDTQMLYIAAFRYALGRQSYIVPTIANVIMENRDLLTDETAALMVREINECKYLGMEIDAQVWASLAKFLSGGEDDEGRA